MFHLLTTLPPDHATLALVGLFTAPVFALLIGGFGVVHALDVRGR